MHLIIAFISVIQFIILFTPAHANPETIDPALSIALLGGEPRTFNIVVSFKTGIESTLKIFSSPTPGQDGDDVQSQQRVTDRVLHNKAILDALSKNADISQESVLTILSKLNRNDDQLKYFKRYPSSNLIFIKEATPLIIHAISDDPQVSRIWEEPIIKLINLESDNHMDLESISQLASLENDDLLCKYNDSYVSPQLQQIQVPAAWAELGDNKGEGVLIGTIGSGVRHTHTIVRDSFVGFNYGWFDAVEGQPETYELWSAKGGIGTGTLGIIVGNNGIGIAPDAKWMSCRACNNTYCSYEAIRDCIKFMECPTLPDGSDPDCTKAPRLVSNHWAIAQGNDVFDEDMLRWREMGIFPIFALGSQEPMDSTVTAAPGDLTTVIGVGAVATKGDLVASSTIGPGSNGTIKPDLVGPGANVYSCTGNYNDDWCKVYAGGTPFACPHVAGVVALLLARDPEMTFDEMYQLITENTDQEGLHVRGIESQESLKFPNNLFGYGKINAFKAIKAQSALLWAKKK